MVMLCNIIVYNVDSTIKIRYWEQFEQFSLTEIHMPEILAHIYL